MKLEQFNVRSRTTRTYLSESFEALLLGVGVDVGSNEEADDVEERHPGVLGQELLRKGQRQRRGHPADLHDGEEAGADGRADLVQSPCTGDDGHRRQIHGVLDGGDLGSLLAFFFSFFHPNNPINRSVNRSVRTYDQIADQDLQDLSLQAGPASEDLLKNANEEVAERGADEHAIEDHLGHARTEVMAVLADIVGDPRGDEFLRPREHTGSEHLSAQRVRLQLLQVHLQITRLGLSSSQPLADAMREIFGLLLDRSRGGFILEFDGHCWWLVDLLGGHGARMVRREVNWGVCRRQRGCERIGIEKRRNWPGGRKLKS